jgi:hypothetical protein
MTADRIDHAAEAANALVRADLQGTDVLGSELRMEALVHATLALVEQQRIANQIAFFGGVAHMPSTLRTSLGQALGL